MTQIQRIPPLRAWFLAFRPKTLTAAVVPIVASLAMVWSLGFDFEIWRAVSALMASICIQIGTNLINDAVDFRKGADTHERLGPMRVTQSGIFSEKQVWFAGSFFFLMALVVGTPLVFAGGLPIVVIGVLSILFGYGYTAGPFPLAYLGLGEIFVILFFGFVAVMGMTFLLTGQWLMTAFLLGLQIGLHATVLIAINNLRDVRQDVQAAKRTLAVRFGENFGKYEIAVLILSPFVLNIFWFMVDPRLGLGTLLTFAALPLGLGLIRLVFAHEPSSVYNQFLAKGAALHLLFGALLSLGFCLCSSFGFTNTN